MNHPRPGRFPARGDSPAPDPDAGWYPAIVYVHDPTLLKKYGTAFKLNRESCYSLRAGALEEEHYIYVKIMQYKRTQRILLRDNSLAVGQELPKLLTRVRSPVIAS